MALISFGRNTLKNLLNSDIVTFRKVIIIEEKKFEYKSFISIFDRKKIPYEVLKKDQFYRFASDKKHQGIIAFLDEYKYFYLQDLVKRSFRKKNPFIIMLDSIEDPHNFGAIIRTCAAFDVDGIIMLDKNQVPVNNTVLKVSTGGLSYVPICRVSSLSEAVKFLKSNGFLIISTVCQEKLEKNDFSKICIDNPVCVVFGNEHDGIRNKIVRMSNYFFSIPLSNEMNSLNVSVSLGIIVSFLKSIM